MVSKLKTMSRDKTHALYAFKTGFKFENGVYTLLKIINAFTIPFFVVFQFHLPNTTYLYFYDTESKHYLLF